MYVAENSGLIEGAEGNPPVSDLVFVIVALVASGILLYAVIGRINRQAEQARASAQALRESNRQLEDSRSALEYTPCACSSRPVLKYIFPRSVRH